MVMDFLPPATQDHLMYKTTKHSEKISKFHYRNIFKLNSMKSISSQMKQSIVKSKLIKNWQE